jgi:hypothetical protein
MLNVILYQNEVWFVKVTSLKRGGAASCRDQFYCLSQMRRNYSNPQPRTPFPSTIGTDLASWPPHHSISGWQCGEIYRGGGIRFPSVNTRDMGKIESKEEKKWSKEAVVKTPCLRLIRTLNRILTDPRPHFLTSTQLSWALNLAVFIYGITYRVVPLKFVRFGPAFLLKHQQNRLICRSFRFLSL